MLSSVRLSTPLRIASWARPLSGHALEWSVDPALTAVLVGVAVVFWRGSQQLSPMPQRTQSSRRRAFYGGIAVVALALMSPVDTLSASLASAHMVQHLLLITVAAPLLAWSSPVSVLQLGLGFRFRRSHLRRLGKFRKRTANALMLGTAAVHATTLWFWHAASAYDRAMTKPLLHRLEHASMLLTAVVFWGFVASRQARPHFGVRVMALFTVALQSTLLAALLTFARSPWYDSYRDAVRPWGLTHLADQQLAGAIMWVPGGFVYLAAALMVAHRWLMTPEPIRYGGLATRAADIDQNGVTVFDEEQGTRPPFQSSAT